MLVAMLNSTFLLIAVYKYDTQNPSKLSFEDYWDNHCEEDWKVAFTAFTGGIPLFLVMLTLSAWVVFYEVCLLYYAHILRIYIIHHVEEEI